MRAPWDIWNVECGRGGVLGCPAPRVRGAAVVSICIPVWRARYDSWISECRLQAEDLRLRAGARPREHGIGRHVCARIYAGSDAHAAHAGAHEARGHALVRVRCACALPVWAARSTYANLYASHDRPCRYRAPELILYVRAYMHFPQCPPLEICISIMQVPRRALHAGDRHVGGGVRVRRYAFAHAGMCISECGPADACSGRWWA